MWEKDLDQAENLDISHLSLYHLTYESKTPIGRAYMRGKIKSATDDHSFDLYQLSCEKLKKAGYVHEEVSNLSLIHI